MPRPESWLEHPSVARLRTLAGTLGELNARVVYIGGAIAPILQTDPPFRSARVTKDVDAIAATTSYADHGTTQERLRSLGFREAADASHAHRWIGPGGILFDLVPAGAHLGASGQEWDSYALRTAVESDLGDGLCVRHASAPAFLALKLAAYRDRGASDPSSSHDLEDILALIASRPDIVAEANASEAGLIRYVQRELAAIASHPDFEDLLAGNLSHAFDAKRTIQSARERIAALVGSNA